MKLNDKLTYSNNETTIKDNCPKEVELDDEKQKLILQIRFDEEKSARQIKIKENIERETLHHIPLVDNNSSKTEMSIDDLLNKIGFNKYHFIIYLIVILSLISDGVELYLVYLIAPVLSYINNYSDNFISMITSVLFIGIAIGSISSGLITKYFGRKNGIMIFLTLIAVFGTFCVSIDNIYWFILCRFIVGISIGYLFNIVNAFCEILPIKYRDFMIGSIFFAIKLGIIYFIFIFYIFSFYYDILSSYKTIVILSSLPMIICWMVAFLYFEESPRILLWDCQYAKAFDIIEKMNKGSSYDFNEEDKSKIVRYIENSLEKEYSNLIKEREKDNNNQTSNYMHTPLNEPNSEKFKQTNYCYENKENSILHFKESQKLNENKKEITLEEKKRIILEHKKSWKNFCEIFQNKKLTLTIFVCLLWMLNTLSLITNLYSLPIILANQNRYNNKLFEEKIQTSSLNVTISNYSNFQNLTYIKNLNPKHEVGVAVNSHSLLFNGTEKIKKILISNLVPLPAEFLAGYLASHEVFEKKSVIFFGFLFMSVCSSLMLIFPDYLYLFSSGINFFSVFAFNITKLYTSLVYHTDNRDFAYGLANFSSRIVSIFVPFIVNFMLNIDLYATCYIMLISSFLGCVVTRMINENLCNKPIK